MAHRATDRKSRDPQVDALLKSRIYHDYQDAFSTASGLPLTLQHPQEPELVQYQGQESPFCALIAKTQPACAECVALQRELVDEARLESRTLKCFAGLCETATPVRMGDRLIAFLHTGHVLLEQPTRTKFNRIAAALLGWGAQADLKRLEDAYFHTRVLSPAQYQSFVRLLEIFAQHLAVCSNQLLLQDRTNEATAIGQARLYISKHQNQDLSLKSVAAAVNLSAGYFSELFKKSTGLTFIDYLARVRVEQAKNLLQNPRLRVTDIAFQCGFGSLSQFNRTFKKISGQSPQRFRAQLKMG